MRHNETNISNAKKAILELDLNSCKLLAAWLSEHIELLEADDSSLKNGINELGLSNRTFNVLRINGIHSLDQLIKLSVNWDNLRTLRGAGPVFMKELEKKLPQIKQETSMSR